MSLLFKISGLAVIFAVSASVGFLKSLNIKNRAQKLGELSRSVSSLAERIRADSGEIGYIIPLCFGENLVYVTDGEINLNQSCLEKEDIALLTEFFNGLGVRDIVSEYERTKLYSQLIKRKADEADEKCAKLCKLYNTVGILSGIFLCIFFL